MDKKILTRLMQKIIDADYDTVSPSIRQLFDYLQKEASDNYQFRYYETKKTDWENWLDLGKDEYFEQLVIPRDIDKAKELAYFLYWYTGEQPAFVVSKLSLFFSEDDPDRIIRKFNKSFFEEFKQVIENILSVQRDCKVGNEYKQKAMNLLTERIIKLESIDKKYHQNFDERAAFDDFVAWFVTTEKKLKKLISDDYLKHFHVRAKANTDYKGKYEPTLKYLKAVFNELRETPEEVLLMNTENVEANDHNLSSKKKVVFIVYGRNEKARRAIFTLTLVQNSF